jgi:hypothetical protein
MGLRAEFGDRCRATTNELIFPVSVKNDIKKSNTGIAGFKCRYLYFISKGLVWRAKFSSEVFFKVFRPQLSMSFFQ